MSTTFDDLVTAATVGIAQRPIAVTELAGPAGAHADVLDPDPAAAVLDAAALLDIARRAGGLAPTPVDLPAPAPPDDSPELSREAGALLRHVLFSRDDRALAAELLTAAAEAGRIAPPPLLPELLELASRDGSLRAPVAALLGERGRWLAAPAAGVGRRRRRGRGTGTAGPGRLGHRPDGRAAGLADRAARARSRRRPRPARGGLDPRDGR